MQGIPQMLTWRSFCFENTSKRIKSEKVLMDARSKRFLFAKENDTFSGKNMFIFDDGKCRHNM